MAGSAEILVALRELANTKQIDRTEIHELLRDGILAALAKKHGPTVQAEVEIDDDKGAIRIVMLKKVVEAVEDGVTEIALEEARYEDPDYQPGDLMEIPVEFAEFGRSAVQACKQRIVQRVREGERTKIRDEFSSRVGDLLSGEIQQIERGKIVLLLNKFREAEAIIPYREQNHRETYSQGEPIRAVLKRIEETPKGPRLILSRADALFVQALFRLEVPEIQAGVVEIRAASREVGSRTKIAVVSRDDGIDPVGACVGLKGARVQAVVQELGGERIDIVPWSADPAVFVSRALAPARVNDVRVNELEKRMTVVVADDQLSLAIGKGGQNARLAARLTGWHIDLVSKTDEKQRHDVERASRLEVEQLGLGEATTEKLIQGGIETVQELVSTPFEKLVELPGIGEKTAEKVMTIALEFMAAYEAAMESATADMGFAPGMEPGEGASPDAAEGGPNG